MISIIAAMGKNRVIGKGGTLPWKLPADMKRFRQLTAHHPVIMGRKTFESIGKPLPNRTNIVITRQPEFSAQGCIIVPSLEAAIEKANAAPGAKEIFIIGGGEIYKQAIAQNLVDRIYLTEIEKDFDGDAYFPEIGEAIWKLVREERGIINAENIYPHKFSVFDRVSASK